MTATRDKTMIVTIKHLELSRREQLRDRLNRAGQLLCDDHGQPVVAVSIYGRENGWFDSRWTTCCEVLEQQAVAIVKERC
jgi:hypothetical protein